MLDNLSDRLQSIFRNLKSFGKLTESNVSEALREVRKALLEADVNYKVVKGFINSVKEKAVGETVLKSITPGQQVVKIVHDELVSLMGNDFEEINLSYPMLMVMMVGLQGSGKTTTSCKLAKYYEKKGRKPLMVACDTQRPAAMEQLEAIGKQNNIPVFCLKEEKDPLKICKKSLEYAKENGRDFLVFDTAGRLHIDEELMDELKLIKKELKPQYIFFVIDAMIGQDAVNVAKSFDESLSIEGVILTKLDGDTRGGAAISVKEVTGKDIKFIGVGEHVKNFEPFHPERMVSRILGMGDIVSLVEKAQEVADLAEMEKLGKKLRKQKLDLEDFLAQLKQIKKMGPLEELLGMIPGFSKMKMKVDEKELVRTEAIISSMTLEERRNPVLFNGSRKKRIAKGSGTSIQDVNILLKNFFMMGKMMSKMNKMQNKMGIGGIPWQ